MSDGIIGEIRLFAGTFEPRGWLFCDGRELLVAQHVTLFSVIGNRFGGDGRLRFALPDLRGRVPIGAGRGPDLGARQLGQRLGAETVRLDVAELPAHRHAFRVLREPANSSDPAGRYLALDRGLQAGHDPHFRKHGTPATLHQQVVEAEGGGRPHANLQPSLVVNYIICVEGRLPIDPARAGEA